MMECNNPQLKSWLPVAPDSDFPIQNLPFGIFQPTGSTPRAGIALGAQVIDLSALADLGYFQKIPSVHADIFRQPTLNTFIALGRPVWRAVRQQVSELFREQNTALKSNTTHQSKVLFAQHDVRMLLPVAIGDYVDFYSSREHATNVGKMFRDEKNPLLPNWLHIPIGYHGRASSVVPSGYDITRPAGQTKAADAELPQFGPCRELDFELEIGVIAGKANALGRPVSASEIDDHIFGFVLVNDWSARDVQRWEYVPLGPFLAKSFATSISPWIVTLDALEPFRTEGPVQEPQPLPYLKTSGPQNFDIGLEVLLQPAGAQDATRICKTNFKHMYWSVAQQLIHATSNGTNMGVGDLYASGTISGPTDDSLGSMLELAWKGTRPLAMPDGTTRKFIHDGDTVIMRGAAIHGSCRIGFGELRNRVLPNTK